MFNTQENQHLLSLQESNNHKALLARVRRNRNSGLAFEREMFSRKSRYLVLFVTLNYRPECRDDITLPTIQSHRDQFIKNMESNPILQSIQGYMWRLEEGERSGGLHLHFMIFYSGEHRADKWFCQLIGDYWVNVVTRGWGCYWNSNAEKEKYERIWGNGIGQVNRNDDAKRDSLRMFITNYMAKANQAPVMRGPHDRLFGCGIFDR